MSKITTGFEHSWCLFSWIHVIFLFRRDMVCSVAGITSDANVLTNELRVIGELKIKFKIEKGFNKNEKKNPFHFALQHNDINWIMVSQCHANNWSRIYVTSSRHTHNTVASVHSACQSCTWAGTNTTAINCINRIPAATTAAGRQHASATIRA